MAKTACNFLGLGKELSDPATSRYAVLPVPFEATVSYKAGTASGPQAILEASTKVELFDEELLKEFHKAGVTTYPFVEPADTPAEEHRRVKEAAGPIVRAGKFLLSIGGEHSITPALVEAVAEVHGEISVLQIDAHADLRDKFGGTKYSHGCPMRRILETTKRLCQVGIRSYSLEEKTECPEQVRNFITPAMIESDPKWIDKAIGMLSEKVYVTIDVDGFDPSIAPGTGTPEPGGLTWQQVTSLLRRLCAERQVVAADIVEVRPIPPNHITEYLAARLACKIIAYTQG